MDAREVGDPAAGYSLTPPEGWIVEAQPGRIGMVAPSQTALVVAMPHAASNARDLASLFQGGWQEPGVELSPVGALIERDDGSGLMDLAGQANGTEARGRLVFLFNPAGGGLILFGLASRGEDAELAPALDAVARTVRFSPPDTSELEESWDKALRGKTLVYLHSYSSSGGGGVLGGGFSEREDIALLPDGTFQRSADFSISIGDAGGGEATGPRTGTWRVLVVAGQAMLELKGEEGGSTAVLAQGAEAGEILLDGRRFFVTDG
jgi:hypothetical protein